MLNLRDDGTITIDFPDTGEIVVRPPRYGAFKRIRAERQRLVDDLTDQIAALPELDAIPPETDQSDAAQAERRRLMPIMRARFREVEEMTAATLAATWRFILIGDDTFAGLAAPKPPDNPDDWPAELLIDAAETAVVAGQLVRTNQTLLDAVAKHWGKVRYHSGPTATPRP